MIKKHLFIFSLKENIFELFNLYKKYDIEKKNNLNLYFFR